MKRKPLLWLARGKTVLKTELAQRVSIDVAALPYNTTVLDWLRVEKQNRRRLVLATASHRLLADQVAKHLALFDEVLATEGDTNLKSTAKAQALVERFGEDGFDYVGNDWPDLQVWQKASVAHVVNASTALLQQVRHISEVGQVFYRELPNQSIAIFKAMRLHQQFTPRGGQPDKQFSKKDDWLCHDAILAG
jgi:hypothetical protein